MFEAFRITVTYELPSRKRQIAEQMRNLIIIEEMREYLDFDGSTVIVGSEVDIDIARQGKRCRILGNTEGDAGKDVLSCDTPLARAIIGRKLGDKFEFKDREVTILSITRIG